MSKDRRAKQVQEALGIGYAHALRLVHIRQSILDSDEGLRAKNVDIVTDCRVLYAAEQQARRAGEKFLPFPCREYPEREARDL